MNTEKHMGGIGTQPAACPLAMSLPRADQRPYQAPTTLQQPMHMTAVAAGSLTRTDLISATHQPGQLQSENKHAPVPTIPYQQWRRQRLSEYAHQFAEKPQADNVMPAEPIGLGKLYLTLRQEYPNVITYQQWRQEFQAKAPTATMQQGHSLHSVI